MSAQPLSGSVLPAIRAGGFAGVKVLPYLTKGMALAVSFWMDGPPETALVIASAVGLGLFSLGVVGWLRLASFGRRNGFDPNLARSWHAS